MTGISPVFHNLLRSRINEVFWNQQWQSTALDPLGHFFHTNHGNGVSINVTMSLAILCII